LLDIKTVVLQYRFLAVTRFASAVIHINIALNISEYAHYSQSVCIYYAISIFTAFEKR